MGCRRVQHDSSSCVLGWHPAPPHDPEDEVAGRKKSNPLKKKNPCIFKALFSVWSPLLHFWKFFFPFFFIVTCNFQRPQREMKPWVEKNKSDIGGKKLELFDFHVSHGEENVRAFWRGIFTWKVTLYTRLFNCCSAVRSSPLPLPYFRFALSFDPAEG